MCIWRGTLWFRESKCKCGKCFWGTHLTCDSFLGIALTVSAKGVDLGSRVCLDVTKTLRPQLSGPGMDT